MNPVKSGTPICLALSSEPAPTTTTHSDLFEDEGLNKALFGPREERHKFLKDLLCRIDPGATGDYLEDENSDKSLEERLVCVLAQMDLSKTDAYAAFVNGAVPVRVELQLFQELFEAARFEENHRSLTLAAYETGQADGTGAIDSTKVDSILQDFIPPVTSSPMVLRSSGQCLKDISGPLAMLPFASTDPEESSSMDWQLEKKVNAQSTLMKHILGL